MRILLTNYRYFVSGGPERYMFNVTEALTRRGHEIIPFSIHYTRNQSTPYARYFVEPLGSRDEVLFHEQRMTFKTSWRTLTRLFYAPDVEHAVTRLVEDTRPQVAYVLHYLRKLSPSLLVGLKKAGLPIVVRLSDYAMLCPQAHCLRNGIPCTLCVKGDLWPSVRYRCVQNNLVVSTLNALATWFHRFRHYFDLIDMFITTNRFMYNMMKQAGFLDKRLCCVPTFVDYEMFHPSTDFVKKQYIIYTGRLERTKGVHVLIEAVGILSQKRPDLNFQLHIAGNGNQGYITQLMQMTRTLQISNVVQFLGNLEAETLRQVLSDAYLSVIPSLWYENLPNTLLESYACGTPVLASDLGALSSSVLEGETGYLFPPGDPQGLAERLAYCLDHSDQVAQMARKARQTALDIYGSEKHIEQLMGIFEELAKEH